MKKVLLLISFLTTVSSFAQDECSSALTLTPANTCQTTSGTLTGATTTTITTDCSGYFDVFYKFVATAVAVDVTLAPAENSSLDLKLSVFDACGSFYIDCIDQTKSGGIERLKLKELTLGTTYYIKVSNYLAMLPANSDFTICVVNVLRPINDECATATLLTPSITCSPVVSGSLLNATTTVLTTSSCANGNSDVFYKFVANAPTTTVVATAGVGIDLMLNAYSECGGTYINCADNTSDGENELLYLSDLIVGETYYIKVADYGISFLPTSFDFTICISSTPNVVTTPMNDECSGAISITPTTTCANPVLGTLANATTSTITTQCPGFLDVFYKFTATASSATVTAAPSDNIDAIVGVFSTCGGAPIQCVDENPLMGGAEVATLNNLSIGTTYFIKVSNYYTSTTSNTFTICVQNNTTTATTNTSALSTIQLFPNPTQNVLNVSNITTSTRVELIELNGKTLLTEMISSETQLDLGNYSAGVYILKLTVDGVTENRRVVLSK
ncbi:T9SS type A sorting domain-containing protein [uncultured Cytophaga sp.]|uniref:T9SS type A sorting domain-containing protein n=1 Tax=uncultured Cytophaga sp. TaxID=160238 RepID=UPI0026083873|nr:T9SS type A sorting domain-containing protein [uncultured Cytophaga sp.]